MKQNAIRLPPLPSCSSSLRRFTGTMTLSGCGDLAAPERQRAQRAGHGGEVDVVHGHALGGDRSAASSGRRLARLMSAMRARWRTSVRCGPIGTFIRDCGATVRMSSRTTADHAPHGLGHLGGLTARRERELRRAARHPQHVAACCRPRPRARAAMRPGCGSGLPLGYRRSPRGLRRGVEQQQRHVHGGEPVHHRVVELRDHAHASVLEPRHEQDLPQRALAAERRGEGGVGEGVEARRG